MSISPNHPSRQLTRRQAFGVGGALGLGAFLAGCSGGGQSGAASTSTSPSASSSASSAAAVNSTSHQSAVPGAAVVLDDSTDQVLNTLFDKVFASTGVAGMAAGVWIGADSWLRSAGYADLATKAPFRPSDHVRIASITKSYTATAVLQLVDQGAIALADTLESFVPGVANGGQITVQNLLGMTSGIYDFTSDDAFLAAFAADPTMPWSDAKTLEIIARHDPLFAPGAELSYCDSNYALLGMVVEKVTGKPAGEIITSAVIDKLALPQTSYPTTTAIPDPHPTGYVPPVTDPNASFDNAAQPPAVVTELNPAVGATAGAMISTLDDLRVWGGELASGTLLSPATQAARLDSRPFPGQKINIGYGLGCETLNEFVGHNGAILGFSTVVMRRPQVDVTIAAVANESTNLTTPTSLFSFGVIKALYPDQFV
jgi:D-alanyl-D-alanine carboxypeptidase